MTAKNSLEKPAGLMTIFALLLGIAVVNSPLAAWYQDLHHLPFHIGIGDRMFEEPLIYWINEGLMVFFFLHVGLEIKSSVTSRESIKDEMLLPGLCAIGGIVFPALIFTWFNFNFESAKGWPIPTATDIVLVLAVLSILGDRIPATLREFLLLLAVFDDIFAIIIIALVFGAEAHLTFVLVALMCVVALLFLNRTNNRYVPFYAIVGLILWQATQHAGVHPTLTGIVLALAFPSRDEKSADALKPWVYFCIVPLFAFFNAGINLRGVDASVINSVVFQGIFFGLLFGKFFGIASATFIVTRLHVCKLPDGVTWQHILGAAFLAGIGFTMSLFMSSLAFENATFIESTKVAVILASLVSGLIGYIILRSGRSDTS